MGADKGLCSSVQLLEEGIRNELPERLTITRGPEAGDGLDEGAPVNDFFDRVAGDKGVDLTIPELEELADPVALVGRAPAQADRFLRDRVDGLLAVAKLDELKPPKLRV